MTPYFDDGQFRLMQGDVRDCLRAMPDQSVQCVVTSPPYYGLRNYGNAPQVWGGNPDCQHDWAVSTIKLQSGGTGEASQKQVTSAGSQESQRVVNTGYCLKCGAWSGDLGSEATPALFVQHLVEVFREVRRVLKDDGTLWLNLGDSYAGSGKGPTGHNGFQNQEQRGGFTSYRRNKTDAPEGYKAKDLMLIPSRVAIALCDDGWYLRSDIAWCKRAPMPESVTDRPTSAWEHIFLLSKSRTYYYDAAAVREPQAESTGPRRERADLRLKIGREDAYFGTPPKGIHETQAAGANQRNYWLLGPESCPDAHFATFPTEIPRRAILAGSREGDTILDPFMGSGTTALVAKRLGRRSVGIELNPEYCALAVKRAGLQLAMLEPTA